MIFTKQLIANLRSAESICVLTGAGISAESGVPTFRGEEGLWKKFRPEELANFDAFIRNPELVWEWYRYRRQLIHEVTPNPGHVALVDLESTVSDFTLVTQNVDNLHRKAGSKSVVELHGNIERAYCIECRSPATEPEMESFGGAPQCKKCGGLVRPDVVWFGEMLPVEAYSKAEASARRCDLFFSIGTSSVVYPAASLPFTALSHGAYVVEINRESTDLSSRANETLFGKAGEILPDLLSQANLHQRGKQ
jgi:NAD-dependent deacetylase